MARMPSGEFVHTIRQSQLVSMYGPGSIIDLQDDSVMPMGLEFWPGMVDRDIEQINQLRLERALNVEYFRQPPPFPSESSNKKRTRIPVRKFPRYHHCPQCKLLTRNFAREYYRRDHTHCPECGSQTKMVPAPFIAACEAGHCQDFPFDLWAHDGHNDCKGELKLEHMGESTGVRDILISCRKCGDSETMSGAFSKNALLGVGAACLARHPWKGEEGTHDCDADLHTMQRGSSAFYFPEYYSSISIPPLDSLLGDVVERFRGFMGGLPEPGNTAHEQGLQNQLENFGLEAFTPEDVFQAVGEVTGGGSSEYDPQEFKLKEFDAFVNTKRSRKAPGARFEVSDAKVPDVLSRYVDQVVIADAIEEIRALVGYRRVSPSWGGTAEEDGDETPRVELGVQGINWLPASRINGEGIFLRFRPDLIDEWAKRTEIQDRVDELSQAVAAADAEVPGGVTGRLLVLHSFAHVLMKQLALDCGYASRSLRERVYSGDPLDPDQEDMAGILIYTGSPDSEGTLGGLARMGRPEELGPVVERAIEDAAWCSSDPVCSTTKNTGERTKNLSACHACLFLPETSCEFFNSYLDRRALVGDLNGKGGYFSQMLE